MKRIELLIILLCVTTASANAQSAGDSATDAAIACLDVQNPDDRLSCLETATRDLAATRVRMETAGEAAADGAPADSAAFEEKSFGAEALPSTKAAKRDESRKFKLSAKVIEFSLDPYGDFTATLDNGQVWRQLSGDTATAHFTGTKKLYTAVVKRGPLNNYRMKINELGRWYRVRRIK